MAVSALFISKLEPVKEQDASLFKPRLDESDNDHRYK
jgi:hypothetical protein